MKNRAKDNSHHSAWAAHTNKQNIHVQIAKIRSDLRAKVRPGWGKSREHESYKTTAFKLSNYTMKLVHSLSSDEGRDMFLAIKIAVERH